jgi:hypothetical protein
MYSGWDTAFGLLQCCIEESFAQKQVVEANGVFSIWKAFLEAKASIPDALSPLIHTLYYLATTHLAEVVMVVQPEELLNLLDREEFQNLSYELLFSILDLLNEIKMHNPSNESDKVQKAMWFMNVSLIF